MLCRVGCAVPGQAPPEPVTSCLSADRLGMERAMLEAVVANEVGRPADIRPLPGLHPTQRHQPAC